MFICVFEVFSETHRHDKHQDWFAVMLGKTRRSILDCHES